MTNTDLIERGPNPADEVSAASVTRSVLEVPDVALKVVAGTCDDIDDRILSLQPRRLPAEQSPDPYPT